MELDALGKSEIDETTYAGVWVVTHHNDENATIGRFIEVTTMPEILYSQKEDIDDAFARLSESIWLYSSVPRISACP